MADVTELTRKSDELYKASKWREGLELLQPYTDSQDPEVLWRVIRVCYRVGKHLAKDKQEASDLATLGYELSERSLKINNQDFSCRKWAGIITGFYGDHAGQSVKIEKSFIIREHFEEAIKLRPNDSYVKHLLGRWCYQVSSLSWFQRKAASMFFSSPPTSSYEEALANFEAAESANPGFYVANWMYLGKTHYQLGHKEEAKRWLTKVMEVKNDGIEHNEVQEEARELLKKL